MIRIRGRFNSQRKSLSSFAILDSKTNSLFSFYVPSLIFEAPAGNWSTVNNIF